MMETRIEKEAAILNNMESLLTDHKYKMNQHYEQESKSFSNLLQRTVNHDAQNEEQVEGRQKLSFAQIE